MPTNLKYSLPILISSDLFVKKRIIFSGKTAVPSTKKDSRQTENVTWEAGDTADIES